MYVNSNNNKACMFSMQSICNLLTGHFNFESLSFTKLRAIQKCPTFFDTPYMAYYIFADDCVMEGLHFQNFRLHCQNMFNQLANAKVLNANKHLNALMVACKWQ